jgi:parvulin-like peptidyl-prolyl isomerase
LARDRRSSERQSRREREAAAERQERLIYLGAGAVLAIVVVVVIAGLYWTRFRPPRAHILTVEDQSYNASAVVDRGKFLITFEGQNDLLGDVASATIDVLIFEETLRRRGPMLVGEVSQDQIDAQVQELLGFDPLATTFTPIPGAEDDSGDGSGGDTADAGDEDEPNPEVTPTPRDELFPPPAAGPRALADTEQDAFLDALASVLSTTGLSKGEFEAIAEARVMRQLLNRHFDEVLGPSGEQLRLSRLRVESPALAAELRQRALDGESFEDLVLETDDSAVSGEDSPAGDLGWFPRDLIPDDIADALEGVEVGGVSEVVDRGVSFEIFFVSDLDPDRIWEDEARQLLVRDLVNEWEEAERELLSVEIDLSDGEEAWIIERVVSHVAG